MGARRKTRAEPTSSNSKKSPTETQTYEEGCLHFRGGDALFESLVTPAARRISGPHCRNSPRTYRTDCVQLACRQSQELNPSSGVDLALSCAGPCETLCKVGAKQNNAKRYEQSWGAQSVCCGLGIPYVRRKVRCVASTIRQGLFFIKCLLFEIVRKLCCSWGPGRVDSGSRHA
jgi:hypothetical protein